MTNPKMVAAGHKAWAKRQENDARRVRDLFRQDFQLPAKSIARRRVVDALRAAGGTTVLDLWGGGGSAREFIAAGFRVISVENGSFEVWDGATKVTSMRKRRALALDASEGGFEDGWGDIPKFAPQADVAFLDFCGPWTRETRRSIAACRHMKAVAVTLVADRDMATGATSVTERETAYQVFLKMAWNLGEGKMTMWNTPVRPLLRYRRPTGQHVFVFLLSRGRHPIRHLSGTERRSMDIDKYRSRERNRMRRTLADPEKKAVLYAYQRQWRRDHAKDPVFRADAALYRRHLHHVDGRSPRKICPLCEAGRAPEATRPAS